jgi:hypothetical protein
LRDRTFPEAQGAPLRVEIAQKIRAWIPQNEKLRHRSALPLALLNGPGVYVKRGTVESGNPVDLGALTIYETM